MNLQFLDHPGPRERHLKRRYHNPLFAASLREISENDLLAARQQDEQQFMEFMQSFRDVVQRAVELPPNAETEVVLNLRDELDGCYASCCAMPGEHQQIQQAIDKLMSAIMGAVQKSAEGDEMAMQKLQDEKLARQMHQQLQQFPLIADLMLSDCPVQEDELTATLLDAAEDELAATLQLFDAPQLQHIYQDARTLLEQLRGQGVELPTAWQRFQMIKQAMNDTGENNE